MAIGMVAHGYISSQDARRECSKAVFHSSEARSGEVERAPEVPGGGAASSGEVEPAPRRECSNAVFHSSEARSGEVERAPEVPGGGAASSGDVEPAPRRECSKAVFHSEVERAPEVPGGGAASSGEVESAPEAVFHSEVERAPEVPSGGAASSGEVEPAPEVPGGLATYPEDVEHPPQGPHCGAACSGEGQRELLGHSGARPPKVALDFGMVEQSYEVQGGGSPTPLRPLPPADAMDSAAAPQPQQPPSGSRIKGISYRSNAENTHSSRRSSIAMSAARVKCRYRQLKIQKSQTNQKGRSFKINCRCQPKHVVNMVTQFDEQKKELVRQTGFGGILELKLTKVNRQFGAWLLSKVDPQRCAIIPARNKVIPFSSKDVNLFFSVPSSGKAIEACSQEEVEVRKAYFCGLFEISNFKTLNVSFLKEILTKQYSHQLTCDEQRAFKAAFVFYVMTKLLAPQSLANFISPRYIRAVADIDNVREYNWSQFVVDDLKKSADHMPKRFSRSSQGSITGCIVFLQALYLSNLDFGCEYLTHDASPSIAAFNDMHVNMMISADLVTRTNPGYPFPKYGKLKLRDTPSSVRPDDRSVGTQSVILGSSSTQLGSTGSPSMDFVYEYLMSRFKSKKLSSVVGHEAVTSINNMVDVANNKFYSIIDSIHDFINPFDNPANVQAVQDLTQVLEQTVKSSLKIAVLSTVRNILSTCPEHANSPVGPLSDGRKNISSIGPQSTGSSEGSGYPRRQSDGSNEDTTPFVHRPVRASSSDLGPSQELETPNNSVTHLVTFSEIRSPMQH
ncbi:uncharacterized protein LOC133884702 [Phragmites australis]|uniref:uncharacterized protein LOC133884702 n=1 Tax=Phragmites australis TaxID=29695 RepID=UPI002D79BCC2|nr:uncharacterized protein LOC133884702 [Phragmites australis]